MSDEIELSTAAPDGSVLRLPELAHAA